MAASGQTLNDRMLAAKHSLAGQGLAKAVCKATTEELIGPKRKHLDYLLRCTEEPNVSIPTLANLLLERVQNPNWIVVFKSLVTIHHMMCYGNERFTQYLASSNTNFQLSSFLDKSGVQVDRKLQNALAQAVILDPYTRAAMKHSMEQARFLGYDMSPFVRRYAKYLAEKSVSYRTVAFDFCKVKRGKDGGTLRQMSTEKLLKTLPTLHDQLDSLLEFEASPADLNNGVINAAFMLLFRDLIRLFACYNDGIINLLEKYFEMNKKNARDALDIYKRFLLRMDRVGEFLKVAEKYGIDKADIPDLAKAPSSLLEALEAHLANLEGRKPGSVATTPTGAGRVNVAAAVNILSSTSSAFGNATAKGVDEKLQKKLLQEEEQAMQKLKEQHRATNPFASAAEPAPAAAASTADATPNILDLFGMSGTEATQQTTTVSSSMTLTSSSNDKASDDLLQLSGNPFASVLNAAGNSNTAAPAASSSSFQPQFGTTAGFPPTDNTGFFGQPQPTLLNNQHQVSAFQHQTMQSSSSTHPIFNQSAAGLVPTASFGSDNSFTNVFGAPPMAAAPVMTTNGNHASNPTAVGANFFGDILQPSGGGNANGFGGAGSNGAGGNGVDVKKIVSGDLDASLANLTSNLNLSSGTSKNMGGFNSKPKGPPMGASANSSSRLGQPPTFPC